MRLLFQGLNGKERVIAEVDNWAEASRSINEFLSAHNFKSYYTRTWFIGDRMCIDVGSHYEFFYLEPYDKERWYNEKEMLKKEN